MGSPYFAVATLSLLHQYHEIVGVVTNPPRPSHRRQKMNLSPIHKFAKQNNILTFTPEKIRNNENIVTELKNLKPDIIVVVAYGKILPQEVLDIPKFGCINIHPSLVPRWRGVAPIEHALMAGDSITGVSILHMGPGLDNGNILCADKYFISHDTNAGILYQDLALIGSKLTLESVNNIENYLANSTPQSEEGVTYGTKLSRLDEKISFANSGKKIIRQIQAFLPKPCAYATIGELSFKIISASFQEYDKNIILSEKREKNIAKFGINDNKELFIFCFDGIIYLHEIQLPGKKAMSSKDFMNGYRNYINKNLYVKQTLPS